MPSVAELLELAELAFEATTKIANVYESAKAGRVTVEEARAALTSGVTSIDEVRKSNNAKIDDEISRMPHATK